MIGPATICSLRNFPGLRWLMMMVENIIYHDVCLLCIVSGRIVYNIVFHGKIVVCMNTTGEINAKWKSEARNDFQAQTLNIRFANYLYELNIRLFRDTGRERFFVCFWRWVVCTSTRYRQMVQIYRVYVPLHAGEGNNWQILKTV